MTSTAARTQTSGGRKKLLVGSCWLLVKADSYFTSHWQLSTKNSLSIGVGLDLQGQILVDVAAVVAGAVRKLAVAALGAADVVDWLHRLMRAAFALAGFAVSLDRKHVGLTPLALTPWAPIYLPMPWGLAAQTTNTAGQLARR
jgi:hypothetical protein